MCYNYFLDNNQFECEFDSLYLSMFETVETLTLHEVSNTSDSSMINDLNINTKNQANIAQVAVLTGIGAAILTRVLSHFLVYCTDSYK